MMPDGHDDPATYEQAADVNTLDQAIDRFLNWHYHLVLVHCELANAARTILDGWEQQRVLTLDSVGETAMLALDAALARSREMGQ